MPSKPINYVLEFKYKTIENGCVFNRESIYGVYSCVGKARKDIQEMQSYCVDKKYVYLGYRIFTTPNAFLVESSGKSFAVPCESRVLRMTDNVIQDII